MDESRETAAATDTPALINAIASDAERLVGQQLALLRAELREEFGEAVEAAIGVAGGVGLIATGGMLSAVMLVHALNRATRWPLWACYGAVAGVLGASGAGLVAAGRRKAANVNLWPPPQSAAELKENVQWLKETMTAIATEPQHPK